MKRQISKKEGVMAKVTLDPMIKDIRGKLGNYVFRRVLIQVEVPDDEYWAF